MNDPIVLALLWVLVIAVGYLVLTALSFVLAFMLGYAARIVYRGYQLGYALAIKWAI